MKLNVGDVVQLSSGSPKMTVMGENENLSGKKTVECNWFEGPNRYEGSFPEAALKVAVAPPAPPPALPPGPPFMLPDTMVAQG